MKSKPKVKLLKEYNPFLVNSRKESDKEKNFENLLKNKEEFIQEIKIKEEAKQKLEKENSKLQPNTLPLKVK